MITYIIGDIFTSPAKVLVNTVNTVGVMGKGLAKDFKSIYPEMFAEYQALCESKRLDVGRLHFYRSLHKWVLNFPTKKHWRNPSRPEYIEAGLETFATVYAQENIQSIAFPPLGCGNGELDWESQVRPLMEKYLRPLPIAVYIYVRPHGAKPIEHRSTEETKAWLRSCPESLGFTEVWDDIIAALPQKRAFDNAFRLSSFTAEIQGTDIIVTRHNEQFVVSQDAILDLWQFVRSSGVISAEGLTLGVDGLSEELFTIMVQLPYLTTTKVSRRRSAAADVFVPALQLLPRQKAPAGGLFDATQAVVQ